jgi:hypothetical protein
MEHKLINYTCVDGGICIISSQGRLSSTELVRLRYVGAIIS